MSHPFSFSRYKMFLSSYLDIDDINLKIYLRSSSRAMTDGEKKRGRQKYKNLNILRKKIAF